MGERKNTVGKRQKVRFRKNSEPFLLIERHRACILSALIADNASADVVAVVTKRRNKPTSLIIGGGNRWFYDEVSS